eukprot:351960-Chlamydomonas_euryale.AAC.6
MSPLQRTVLQRLLGEASATQRGETVAAPTSLRGVWATTVSPMQLGLPLRERPLPQREAVLHGAFLRLAVHTAAPRERSGAKHDLKQSSKSNVTVRLGMRWKMGERTTSTAGHKRTVGRQRWLDAQIEEGQARLRAGKMRAWARTAKMVASKNGRRPMGRGHMLCGALKE